MINERLMGKEKKQIKAQKRNVLEKEFQDIQVILPPVISSLNANISKFYFTLMIIMIIII